MQSRRQSPPKHRHDGTSPLPLGMDWSPPPRRWNGRDTVWPHDPHTGWSYCVAIPSWVVLPKSRDSDPVVFYRVQVGIQSPEGVTTIHGVLRRFNDFLKLFADLRKAFPKKALPPAPPKGLLRLKSRVLLEERRCSLEEWMTKLLSDIDLSRSVVVASFLELEAAARSSFQDANGNPSEASIIEDGIPSFHSPSSSNYALVAGSSSVASDNGSDTAYETSEIGTPSLGRHDSSEIGLEDLVLDEDLTGPIERFMKFGMSNIDEGLFMGQTILAQLEGFPNHKMDNKNSSRVTGKDVCNGNGPRNSSVPGDGLGLFSESEQVKMVSHARKTSIDSVGSDLSSVRGSEISISGIPNSSGGGSHVTEGAEASSSMRVANFEFHPSHDAQILLPMDQRQKMNKVLLNMQQKLTTARTDMEDLIARLNQEMAVKDYLMTKVKDLEVELETTKQKNKENLQQAILSERERTTKIQWEMEELRRKTVEMELKLHPDKDNKAIGQMSAKEEDLVMLELNNTKEQLGNLSKRYLELESKSKADIKVLVKEVKSLRNSQKELKQELTQSQTEKFNAEELLHRESESNQHVRRAAEKLMTECRDLHSQLLECNVDFFHNVNENRCMSSSSLKDASDILAMSDDKINLLLEEVERFRQNNPSTDGNSDYRDYREHDNMPEIIATYDELRKILAEIIISSMKLRKQVNSFIRCNIKTDNVCFNPETEQSSQEDNLVKVGLTND